ncbi:MAG: DUF3052 domain-containing protein [candidate division WOR-3 bacterium]|nr:DUF3052 domain-containing protein [candidate division WOR-3 bacterium]
MKKVCLFHRHREEVEQIIPELNKAGYLIEHSDVSPAALRRLKENPPAAVIIDLTHAPSGGRDVGIYVRHYRATRLVPIIFAGGTPEKVAKVKEHIPDAVYTEWRTVRRDLKHAILHPPVAPVAPDSLLAGYSGIPLVKKLGIKPNTIVTLIDAPHDFDRLLLSMPAGVILRKRFSKQNDLIIWFVKSRKVLQKRVGDISKRVGNAGLWIVWPKKSSHIPSDLSQRLVREAGLNAGLVDYKVCAIDRTWAGLKFSVRKTR